MPQPQNNYFLVLEKPSGYTQWIYHPTYTKEAKVNPKQSPNFTYFQFNAGKTTSFE